MSEQGSQVVSVRFSEVTKVYQLGNRRASLRAAIMGLMDQVLQRGDEDLDSSYLKALDRVSFEIRPGESVGIIGPNGSGKTTTLKLISDITKLTDGTLTKEGRTSSLIELGAGFHPDLTGRENIYFNAAILGMRRSEIQERFDAIVDFSGLERFLDTPVKRYSSGMYCRLGFAVAAHVNPDILLVDEVLAVGDASFQAKCLKRMHDLIADGTTVIFVTHNLGYLQRLCDRAIFLHRGRLVQDGPVADVIQTYRDHDAFSQGEQEDVEECAVDLSVSVPGVEAAASASPVQITEVFFTAGGQDPVEEVRTGAKLNVHVGYRADKAIDDAIFEIWLYGMDGVEYASFATPWDGLEPMRLDGLGQVGLQIEPLCLMPGSYYVQVAIADRGGLTKYDMHWDRHRIVVRSGPVSYGLIYQPHHWLVNGSQHG